VQDNVSPGRPGASKIADSVGEDTSKVSPDRYRDRLRLPLIVAAVVITLDQLSKLWVRDHFALWESLPIIGRLSLTYHINPGAAFGLLDNQTELLIIMGIASLFIILLFLRYLSRLTTLSLVSIGLIWGGAVGNLIDRIRFGYVTDFIDFRLWGDFHWPTFNIADAAITVGVVTLIYHVWRWEVSGKAHERQLKPQN
jgi:signal peptidase II